MIDKVKYYFHVATDKYLIEVAYVEGKPVPSVIEKNYIIYDDKTGKVNYTQDPKQATIFGIVLGGLVVRELRSQNASYPNLQINLVSVNDATFIDKVTGGPKQETKAATA